MSLEDSIKADAEALAKLQAGETEEVKEEIKEEQQQEAVAEDAAEEPKEEPKKEEKPAIDNAAYARMRIEKAAAEQKARELEARLEALEKARSQPAAEEREEETAQTVELPHEVQDLVRERQIQAAKDHFATLEQEFVGSGDVADYDAHIKGYAIATYRSLQVLNPTLTPRQLEKETEFRILTEAAKYNAAGKNPAEELYNIAKARGYKYEEPAQQEPVREEIRKPNLDRVAENKKRSAGMASAGGASNEISTLKAAIDMDLSKFSMISSSELERLEKGLR